jgi:amino acid adenylation domain-containing protein
MKIGQRVELGEIEEAVYKHQGVKTVSVVVLGSVLVVFTLVGDEAPAAEDVMGTCSKWLPTFMMPNEIVLLRNFPYLPSGKVDKQKLISDYQQQRNKHDDEDYTNTSDTSKAVREILQDLLGSFPARIRLAAIGVDSLVAIRVASKLRLLGFSISAVSILKCDTLNDLVDLCENSNSNHSQAPNSSKRNGVKGVTAVLNGNAKNLESSMLCTPVQSAMLAETALDEKAYRNWVEIDLPNITDLHRVITAIYALAEANSILRTGFTESPNSDGYVQIMWRKFPDSQIEHVTNFNYDFDPSKDASFHHPVRFQILQKYSSTGLLMHIHHALYDAWSLELLLDDLETLLLSGSLPERPPFVDVVEAYADGTLKYKDWISKDYWKDHLSHLDLRQMPNFHSRNAPSPGLSITRLTTSISTSVVEAVARRLSSSPQSIFQAAYALILGSYLGSSDICFGTVFSGRTLPIVGIEDIAGPCLATLPVRVDLSLPATVQDLVRELNTTNRKHLEFCDVPLRDIKFASGVRPRQLLFDTLLIWQQTLHSHGHTRKHVSLVDTVDNLEFNLTLEVIPSSKKIEMKANFQRSVFPESQINALLNQIEQLVRIIIEDEVTPLAEVFNRLSTDVLSIGNEDPDLSLKGGSLSFPVEKIAVEDPNRIAIEFANGIDSDKVDSDRMSYLELNSRANQVGHFLLEQNVLPDELVCICLEKSTDLYASILATAKIGAGYLPVTPDIPSERLKNILREAKVKILMAETSSRPLLKSLQGLTIAYIDQIRFDDFSTGNVFLRSSPENIAYSVFTSGSTGAPKGILVTQGNLLSNLDVLEDLYPASKESRFLQSCSQAFDVSVFEIFFAWRVGGCLCSATKDVLFRDIENAIRVLNVTHLSLTPTVAALINPRNVPKVEFLVTAGEAVTQKVFNTWADKGLWQGYGPSETTNICTVNPKVSRHDSLNNIGPPFRNTSAFVLAPNLEFALAPRGGEGEFCFGGSQVFRGYMDRSQEDGKIINHPKFGRLYRSGDFGRLMPDGSLSFTGRKDDQVKIRGQRVELSEITNVLLRSGAVKDCITMVVNSEEGLSQRLVSFWTSNLQTSESFECVHPDSVIIEGLYRDIELALPAYMVPSSLVPVSFLSSTSQGKIDKRALVKLFLGLDAHHLNMASKTLKSSSDHTWTVFEKGIAKAVAQVSGMTLLDVGPDTSFFSLGIDSISAISISRTLQQILNCEIQISDILKHPSVVRLANKLESRSKDVRKNESSPATSFDFGFDEKFHQSTIARFEKSGRSVQAILPCTPLQEGMLSAAESSSEKLYDNHVTLKIIGSLEKIKESFREMVKRHGILRTCFVGTDMSKYAYAQVVLNDYELDFGSITSLAEWNSGRREFEPPYTIDVMESDGSIKLLISMHHALYDGVALSVLYEEIESLYHGKSLPPPISFAPFLQKMAALDMNEADSFWNALLKGCMPSRFRRAAQPTSTGPSQNLSRIVRTNSRFSIKWVEENIKQNSTTLLAVLHTAWASLLSEYLHETDICFGNVVSGRTVPVDGIERLVAPCFNTIPSRLQNIHSLSYLEAFRKLQNLNADSIPFQMTPLRRIQGKFSRDGLRLFETLFILQQPLRELDPSIWSISDDDGAMDFPLVCEVVPKQSDDTLEIILHSYNTIFNEEEASALLNGFEERILTSLQNPRRQILSAAIRDQIITEKEKREISKLKKTTMESSTTTMSADEEKVREIISSFTDVPSAKIGREMSIFRLGLDSISTVQVAARLRKQGYNVLASDILEHPTIAQLSAFLLQLDGKIPEVKEYDFDAFDLQFRETICSKYGLNPERVEAVRPCTAVQKGMLAQTLHSNGWEYVNSMSFELLPGVSNSNMKAAWETVCTKHEMLRSGFASLDDPKNSFVMITYAREHFPFPWLEDTEDNSIQNMNLKDLLERAWKLSIAQKDGRPIIKFTAHHALYDAQSIQMILSDIAEAFASLSVSNRPPITSLLGAILHHSEDDVDGQKLFWEREENKIIVNRFPDLTSLQISDRASEVQEISSTLSIVELEELCRHNGVTMQAAAQATWARLLAAYIGESSTTFGMTLSGRSVHEDADEICFPSIVTVPVRCEVTGTNFELLSRTITSNASLHKYQFTPLTSIQKWAGFPEGKIFDTLFAYQKLPDGLEEVGLPWKVVREEASVDYAVSLEVQPTKSGELTLRLTFRVDLIPVEHAELLLRQYDALLQDTLRNPDSPCDPTPRLDNQLLSITPAKDVEIEGSEKLLHEYVERGAQQWPKKIALQFATSLNPGCMKSKLWSYEQLNNESNKVAHLILKYQIAPGKIIAICFDKCAEASFAIIGILKTGCAYVALDPNAPAERLNFIIKDSGASLMLSAGEPGRMLQGILDEDIIMLDSPGVLEGCSFEQPNLTKTITPQGVAYCLYTSGTTGTPKGCLITHDNTVQFLRAFQKLFAGHWAEDSKYLQFASFHFDVSVMEQFFSWSIGICVASAPRDLIFEDITGAIQQLGITHLDLTPSLARLIHPDDVPSLCKGAFITGGEQLKQEILDVWGEHAVIYNGYGPTEATIGCTMYQRVPRNGKPSNIGPQYDNVGSFVMKPGTELPVLRGGIGELCVSGKLVGKGYLNRPDLTEEKFPTLKTFNERVYRTGDLVRILHDGCFIFLGRADDQVKLRGQRLELSEINEVIKKSSKSLQDVVTLVLKHSTQQKEQLVSFVVKSSNEEDGNLISIMRDACKSRLPGYMIPTHFIPINALPLNANNKADSNQLAAIYDSLTVDDLQKLSQSSQKAKEWTEIEQTIVRILAEAMHVEQSTLTRGSNIFELGLDSISIIGFSRALQDVGLENAKLSVVKNHSSIGGLVKVLLGGAAPDQGRENAYIAASQAMAAFSQRHMVDVCVELGIENTDVEAIVPCTPVQEGMIYRFLESEYLLYFNKFEFRLDDAVDTEKLLAAWNRVVSRLQVLRTKFVSTDDGYAQVVLRKSTLSWADPGVDFDSVEKSSALKTPYILSLSSSRYLTLRIFHGLYDGNSLTMLLHCVKEEYLEFDLVEYGPSFTSSLPYALAKVPGCQQFWSRHLENWTLASMSTISESTGDVVATATIDGLSGFEALRKQLGVTPQAVIQAVWLSILQSLISSNITIGIVASGRAIDFEGADKVIGPLFNTIPFHLELEPGTPFASLISECHEFNMQMQDFQHTSLKDIQKWSPANPGQPLFDTLFVFQRPDANNGDLAEEIWTSVDGAQVADYPLAFEANLSLDSRQLDLTIVAQGSVITKSGAADLLERFRNVLNETIQNFGKNILSQFEDEPIMKRINGRHVPDREYSITPREPFTWTKNAHHMRQEIAMLAKVSENTIHEHSSIFELGLDSIDVIKLSSRLKKRGIEISVSAIIKSQSIGSMSQNISIKDKKDSFSNGKSLDTMSRELTAYLERTGKLASDVEMVLPATPLQQSMVNEMIKSGYTRYFNVDAFKLSAGVDPKRLMAAAKKTVEQSPILRTTFVQVDDPKLPVSFAQIVHREPDSLNSNLSICKSADEQTIEDLIRHFQSESKALAAQKQALLQVHCISLGLSQYLLIAISHALYDGTSLRFIHEDIQQAYHGELKLRPDFMPFLEDILQSTTEEAKKFWRTTLSNLPAAKFPRKGLSDRQYGSLTTRLERRSRVPLQRMEELCKSSRTTMQTLGQTCWALVLSHLMGQLDVVFGSVLSCRDSEEASEVMFPLMNTVAVRSVPHGSLLDMLKYTQEMSDTTRQYQHFPLGTAQAYAMASRQSQSTSDATLVDTLFIYQGRRSTAGNDKLYESVYGNADVEFPVCAEMEIVDDEYVSWTMACKSTAAGEAEEIVEALETVLEHILTNPEAQTLVSDVEGISICGLPKFKKAETKPSIASAQLINGFNDKWSTAELTVRRSLHEISNVAEDAIHKDSTIFHLGLDSILVLKLPVLLKKYGIKLSVSDILREQTVYAMAKAAAGLEPQVNGTLDIDSILATLVPSEALSSVLGKVEKQVGELQHAMPVTAGELYMIRKWQASRGAMFYQTFTYSLTGPINKTKLEAAWSELLRRHDILRTGFLEAGTDIVQVVFKNPPNEIIYDPEDNDFRIRKHRKDLTLPPLNLVVDKIDYSSVVLKVVLHHALYDGISLPILVEELQSLYQGRSFSEASNGFRTFIAQSISAASPNSTKDKWKSYLQHETIYPTRSIVTKRRQRTEVFHPLNQISNVKQLAQDSGVSIDALFLASVAKLLAHKLGSSFSKEVVFGIYLANRAPFGEDLSELAAPTLNLLPLRVRDPLSRSIQELAKEVQMDIHEISSKEMVSASLAEIYAWTGVRVNFFVNILKSVNPSAKDTLRGNENEWLAVHNPRRTAKVVEEVINDEVEVPTNGRCDAYLVCFFKIKV